MLRLKAALPKAAYELLELAYSLVAYRQLVQAAKDFQPDFIYERYNLSWATHKINRTLTPINPYSDTLFGST